MKKLTRRMLLGLIMGSAVLAFLPGATGKDKLKNHAQATIMAIAQDGTTRVAGEVRFSVSGDTLEVSIDLASGVPNAKFAMKTSTDPDVISKAPELPLLVTDERGNLKYTALYGISTLDPFDVWVDLFVGDTAETFTTKLEPVTMDPRN